MIKKIENRTCTKKVMISAYSGADKLAVIPAHDFFTSSNPLCRCSTMLAPPQTPDECHHLHLCLIDRLHLYSIVHITQFRPFIRLSWPRPCPEYPQIDCCVTRSDAYPNGRIQTRSHPRTRKR